MATESDSDSDWESKLCATLRKMMRLHIVSGSFVTADASAEEQQCAMDPAVWSTMPDDLVWRVVRMAPAAKQFQWHLVSRQWRHTLASHAFRKLQSAPAASAAGARGAVVAYVTPGMDWHNDDSSKAKVVEIDLSSFVPGSFWTSDSRSYSVAAAGAGLVCISNQTWEESERAPDETRYCVLNPLTRSCKVLPPLPVPWKPQGWLPLTPTAVTAVGYAKLDAAAPWAVVMATCDLAAGSTGGWDVAAYLPRTWTITPRRRLMVRQRGVCKELAEPVTAVCAGETFLLDDPSRTHVLAPGPGGSTPLVEVAAAVPKPAVSFPGLDVHPGDSGAHLVAHRGAVFLVQCLELSLGVPVLMAVWRLARDRLQWEPPVAWLDAAELERLTGLTSVLRTAIATTVWPACGDVSEGLLYCRVEVGRGGFLLGVNLDTGVWELVHDEKGPSKVAKPVELRPDLYVE